MLARFAAFAAWALVAATAVFWGLRLFVAAPSGAHERAAATPSVAHERAAAVPIDDARPVTPTLRPAANRSDGATQRPWGWIALALLVLCAAVATGWWALRRTQAPELSPLAAPTSTVTVSETQFQADIGAGGDAGGEAVVYEDGCAAGDGGLGPAAPELTQAALHLGGLPGRDLIQVSLRDAEPPDSVLVEDAHPARGHGPDTVLGLVGSPELARHEHVERGVQGE